MNHCPSKAPEALFKKPVAIKVYFWECTFISVLLILQLQNSFYYTTQATEPKLCCIFNRLLACASIKHGRHCILFWKRTSGGGTVACGGGKNFQLYSPTELHCSRKLKFCQTTKEKILCFMLLILYRLFFLDWLCNILPKFTWIVLSVHKLNKLGKFW